MMVLLGKENLQLGEGNLRLGEVLCPGEKSLHLGKPEGFQKRDLHVRLGEGLHLGEPEWFSGEVNPQIEKTWTLFCIPLHI